MTLCEVCGTWFAPRNQDRPPRTCSRACTNKMVWQEHPSRRCGPEAQPRTIAACDWCGEPVKWARRPGRQGRFCSRVCAGRSKTKGGVAFRGGRWRVRLRDGGWQLYSRCLMEATLGRHLAFNDVVHHINGDPTDDRLENLDVMARSDHSRMHTAERWAILRSQGRS